MALFARRKLDNTVFEIGLRERAGNVVLAFVIYARTAALNQPARFAI